MDTQVKLFDKKFVALTLRDARHCDKCKREFDVKFKHSATDNKPHSCRPVLLNCGHNICENCIYQNRHNLTCAVCSIPIELEHSRWLKKSYDFNFCLLGQLTNFKSFLSSDQSGTYFQHGTLAQELFVQKCSECEMAAAVGVCMHCKVDFCKRCFHTVHQNSKVLKKHRLSEFEVHELKLNVPSETYCKIHKRLCDRFCADCQKICCFNCVSCSHIAHFCTPLSVENANHKDKIMCLLETLKPTREMIRTSQKEARAAEKRLEDFATSAVLDINNYFLDLHNHLQLEERRVLESFKKTAGSSQKAIHEALSRLANSQTTLNDIRSKFEGYIHKPPHEFHIYSVLELATKQIESIPCQIHISENETNPFIFKKLKDIRKEITNSYEVIAEDQKLGIKITPVNGEQENFLEIDSDRMMSTAPLSLTRTESTHNYDPSVTIASSCTLRVGKSKRIAKITHIESPSHFYIQNEEEVMALLKQHLTNIDCKDDLVESVITDEMYMVYHGNGNTWLRGIPKNEVKKKRHSKSNEKVYKVYLLDYGIYANIPEKWFRKTNDELKSISAGAIACKLTDLAPNDEKWLPAARDLMQEIIQNMPVQIIIQDTTKTPWNVEIITSTVENPVPIREALLYSGLGVDSSSSLGYKNKKSSFLKVSKIKERLSKAVLRSGEIFRVKITHVENPHQFFAVKFAQLTDLTKMETELDLEYSQKSPDIIYCAQLQMCCALSFEDKWYRGCIEDTNDPNHIRVRLVDDGRTVAVHWRQLHVLKDCFTKQQELAIECSLADIEPLQKNNYEWTDDAIAEFTRMTKNPNIQLTISSSSKFRYKVYLNVPKKQSDVNIGAMLVAYSHALATGECCAIRENLFGAPSHMDEVDLRPEEKPKEPAPNSAVHTLKRTPVQVIHIENPGEFYIHLVDHIPGIVRFHEELQLAQRKSLEAENPASNVHWNVSDHCLVLTTAKDTAGVQWYRGVIVNNSHNSYEVFLRDKGITVRNVKGSQLTKIPNLFDRICNAALLCHLACVQPTGGVTNWSNSSIDGFTHSISTFHSLGATIQGDTKNSSIPIVLWGIVTESNDPLAPCITKYININKGLVCAGLAHLVEKIDLTRQLDNFVQSDAEGQQTLQDWYDSFINSIDELAAPCLGDSVDLEENESHLLSVEIDDPTSDCEPVSEWLPAEPIEKFTFTGYPTYIDEEAIVYLHDADKHSLLATIRKKINNEHETKPTSGKPGAIKWNIGQPCLARYHADNSLYRAIIQRQISDQKYEVRFVDYGNVEMCEEVDLQQTSAFSNIPVQAVRFRIDGIKPKEGKPSFPIHVLDLIHGLIVDKLCAIRVPSSEAKKEIKKCDIRINQSDVATYLVRNNFVSSTNKPNKFYKSLQKPLLPPCPIQTLKVFADAPHKENNESDDELKEFLKCQITDLTDESQNKSPVEENIAMFNPNEYKEMFEKLQNEKFFKSLTDVDVDSSSEDHPDNNAEKDADIDELDFTFRTNCCDRTPPSDSESNFNRFEPLDTSSLLSNFSGIEIFVAPQLPSSVTSFQCEIVYVRSPTILHLCPHLRELNFRQFELAQLLQLKAKKAPNLTTFEPKTPCLARYSKDNLWYRAIIRSHNPAKKEVQVFYVDFLNTERLNEEHVRKASNDFLQWPLRTFEMKLHGVKSNPKLRERTVKAAVKKCFKDNTVVYAKIVQQVARVYEVILYKSVRMEESLIDHLVEQDYLIRA